MSNTNTMQLQLVSIESVRSAQWWPDLFLKKGRVLRQIQPSQCPALMEAYRDGRGVSQMRKPQIDIHDGQGQKIGRISYNGCVWLSDICGEIEVPTN